MNRDEKLKITNLTINKNNLLGLNDNKQSIATIISSWYNSLLTTNVRTLKSINGYHINIHLTLGLNKAL
jgi:hypothetical protein